MSPGEFFVDTDSGDVVLVFANFNGDIDRWAIAPESAWDLAAQLMVAADSLEDDQEET